jgi:ribonuclease R
MANDKKFSTEILRILAVAPPKGFRQAEILERLGSVDFKRFRRLLKQLCDQKLVIHQKNGTFLCAPQSQPPMPTTAPGGRQAQGVISVTSGGFAFVKQEEGLDIFIPPTATGGAITDDTVLVELTSLGDSRGPVGRVVKILERAHLHIVGCLAMGHDGLTWYLRPLRREMPQTVLLEPVPHPETLRAGNWVRAELHTNEDGSLSARLEAQMEASGTVTADLDAIVAEYQIPAPYTAAQESAARRLKPLNPPREDLTGETVVTIDPADARDFDDALSCSPIRDGKVTVGVHIADVSCFVKTGSTLDEQARQRCFTSYLPGRTLPMLPHSLADELCSLQPGVPRLAHSVFVTIDVSSGRILSWRRAHTTIRSTARLCYEEVQDYLDGGPLSCSPEVKSLLDRLASTAKQLRQYRRAQEMFLPMDMPEIRPICTEHPSQILGVQKSVSSFSHELVEEFMLAANQCVAAELLKLHLPGIFRNHQSPDGDSLLEFAAQAQIILQKRIPPLDSRRSLVRFLRSLADSPLHDLIATTLLRHLPRANYGARSEGHFGLGKELYSHFTSPIRRYADLLVHQQLLAFDMRKKTRSQEQMEQMASQCSLLEERCDQAAFSAYDRMKIRYLMQLRQADPNFQTGGDIVKVTKAGLTVYLDDYGLQGVVPAQNLPGHGWVFEPGSQAWRNRRTGTMLTLRQHLPLALVSADPIRGEIALRLA